MPETLGNIVIAGGSKGIGLALVERLRSRAAQVLVLSRQVDSLQVDDIVSHFEVDFSATLADVLPLPDVIHAAVYCPGTINLRSFRSLKEQDFRNDLEVNLLGAVRFLQACWPALSSHHSDCPASVLFFSTVAVGQGMPMHASIASAKGAVEGLTRSLAAKWAPRIRVNCLAPALTETPLTGRFFSTDSVRQTLAAKYPLARTGKPDDLAAMAEFLLSPESSWITGQIIGVDGGLSTLRK